jgi:ElaB/YqjD/DUF883 family membrane-anchored ribosome-binding protein
MSDAKDKTKESIEHASVKAEQATERVGEKIKGGADEKKLETDGATGRVKDAVQEGVDSAKKAADSVTEKISDLSTGARDYAEKAVAKLHEGSEQAADFTRQSMRHAASIVRANPGPSLALVFGAGIGIGLILGSALRPSRDQWPFTR